MVPGQALLLSAFSGGYLNLPHGSQHGTPPPLLP